MAARASKQTPPDEENVWYTATKLDRSDLSPLTRGKPRPSSTRRRALRLISAHTGKTPRLSDRSCHVTAHPRSREENIDAWQLPERHVGSSPLARGKRRRSPDGSAADRLIPAHAGKTLEKTLAREPSGAHPRSRGENLIASSSMRHRSGSSPLTRGKPRGLRRSCGQRRLIPAHAGKTRPLVRPDQAVRAHPRSRGENRRTRYRMSSRGGSSPLTRGKRLSSLSLWGPLGLIPAHAGKTHTYWHRVGPRSAHPRSRGENSPAIPSLFRRSGSSPLTRGKPGIDGLVNGGGRLIPAHAGKTALFCEVLADRGAHPRSRGENVAGVDWGLSEVGSSPLTRGKHC